MSGPRPRLRRFVRRAGIGAAAVAVAIQLVPYGRDHDNPAVLVDAPWPSERARDLAVGACYDCHSNETDWPAYSVVAPMSWLVTRDVEDGRDELNFSEWERGADADDGAETVAERSMPPRRYTLLHPDARLSAAERRELVEALTAMDRAERRN